MTLPIAAYTCQVCQSCDTVLEIPGHAAVVSTAIGVVLHERPTRVYCINHWREAASGFSVEVAP